MSRCELRILLSSLPLTVGLGWLSFRHDAIAFGLIVFLISIIGDLIGYRLPKKD